METVIDPAATSRLFRIKSSLRLLLIGKSKRPRANSDIRDLLFRCFPAINKGTEAYISKTGFFPEAIYSLLPFSTNICSSLSQSSVPFSLQHSTNVFYCRRTIVQRTLNNNSNISSYASTWRNTSHSEKRSWLHLCKNA